MVVFPGMIISDLVALLAAVCLVPRTVTKFFDQGAVKDVIGLGALMALATFLTVILSMLFRAVGRTTPLGRAQS